MLHIDGAMGEGGGQILRTSLALAIITGTPVSISRIRANRRKPGLRRQHLAAALAAQRISGAEVVGAELDSKEVMFRPAGCFPSTYAFDIGSAGSATLVLQTILPALILADGESRVTIQGGTHNPMAPSFDFIRETYLPLLARMGPKVEASIDRHGFAPTGKGQLSASIQPAKKLAGLSLTEPLGEVELAGRVLLADLPDHVAEREAKFLSKRLSIRNTEIVRLANGPGNAVVVAATSEALNETFWAPGSKGVQAEKVAGEVVTQVKRYLREKAPVGPHLADQLVLLNALAGEGAFLTGKPSGHLETMCKLLPMFLPVSINCFETDRGWRVEVVPTS